VRIQDENGHPLEFISVALTRAEAHELAKALSELDDANPGWYAQVCDEALRRQITIYRDDDPTVFMATPRGQDTSFSTFARDD